MKTHLTILISCLFATISFAQNTWEISNSYLNVRVRKGKMEIHNKQAYFPVRDIQLSGNVLTCERSSVTDSLFGNAQQLQVTYENGRIATFRLYPSSPFVHMHTAISNQTEQEINLKRLDFADITVPFKQQIPMNVLGTGGLQPIEKAQGSFSYTVLAQPATYHSLVVAWLTQKQGIGCMLPEWNEQNQTYTIHTELQFGAYRIKPGEQRGTDTLLIGFFPDGRQGLELYSDQLVKAYHIILPPKPEVYCTWYHRNTSGSGASTEKLLAENAAFAKAHLSDFGLNTFQIDDEWQSQMMKASPRNPEGTEIMKKHKGPITSFIESNHHFPSGMKAVADELRRQGFCPGIWFMPFSADAYSVHCNSEIFAKNRKDGKPYTDKRWSGSCIDASSPYGEIFLRDRFQRIYNWGYRYWKIDGLHTGAPSDNLYIQRAYKGEELFGDAQIANPDLTFVQCFRKGLNILKEEAPDVFLLGCCTSQNMISFASAFGMTHAMRVGPDNDGAIRGKWDVNTRGADYAGNLYFLHNKVWYNDPDPYYIRESNPWNKAKWMVSWQAVSGMMGTTSIQYSMLPPERLELLKRALPTHKLNARPVDILESEKPQIWIVRNERSTIVGLFNWSEQQAEEISYPLQRMGLEKNVSYEVFDYWDNCYKGSISRNISATLEGAGCKVLSLKQSKPYPQVISTSRHITQGLIDLIEENWDKASKTLSGCSEVVANDKYELRLVIPENYQVKEALMNGENASVTREGKLVRISFVPAQTGRIEWHIRF